jgi:hypothetical protein
VVTESPRAAAKTAEKMQSIGILFRVSYNSNTRTSLVATRKTIVSQIVAHLVRGMHRGT